MTIQTINDHQIDLPADMTVDSEGMWTTIEYRGATIITHEKEVEPALYVGPFAVLCDFEVLTTDAADLTEVRALVDAKLGTN